MNGSNWTGKTARTLSEAFGPYADAQIDSAPHWSDSPLNLLAAAVVAVLVCGAVVSVLFDWSAQ
jgi:hypothetical protein